MPADCHVETHRDNLLPGFHRATVVHTATGATLYVTWPYRDAHTARDRAWLWIREEHRKLDAGKLFE